MRGTRVDERAGDQKAPRPRGWRWLPLSRARRRGRGEIRYARTRRAPALESRRHFVGGRVEQACGGRLGCTVRISTSTRRATRSLHGFSRSRSWARCSRGARLRAAGERARRAPVNPTECTGLRQTKRQNARQCDRTPRQGADTPRERPRSAAKGAPWGRSPVCRMTPGGTTHGSPDATHGPTEPGFRATHPQKSSIPTSDRDRSVACEPYSVRNVS